MTISEIAKLAGVSSAAVSRYLRREPQSGKTSANRKGDSGDQVPGRRNMPER